MKQRATLSLAVLRFDLLPDTALLSVADVCTLLGRSRASVYRALRNGDLRSVKIGGSRRVTARAIREAAGHYPCVEQSTSHGNSQQIIRAGASGKGFPEPTI
jgi:excisionase family DNA binding protein